MSELPRPIGAIARIAHIIGPAAALALAEARGGTHVYVPKEPSASCPLVKIVGMEAAVILAAAYGGDTIKVPVGREWRVMVLRAGETSYARIALSLGIDENTVHRILKQQDMTNRQLRLFE